jgi:hypothetical protein
MSFLDPTSDPERQSLIDLRNRLLQLHKTLLEDEKRTYERVHGPVGSPGAFLQLLLSDSWFAWLRPVTSLVVVIDEALAAREPLTEETARQFLVEARGMLTETGEGRGLGKAYFDALQRNPDVGVLHGEIMKIYAAQANEQKRIAQD